jgi:hypothetical protein
MKTRITQSFTLLFMVKKSFKVVPPFWTFHVLGTYTFESYANPGAEGSLRVTQASNNFIQINFYNVHQKLLAPHTSGPRDVPRVGL